MIMSQDQSSSLIESSEIEALAPLAKNQNGLSGIELNNEKISAISSSIEMGAYSQAEMEESVLRLLEDSKDLIDIDDDFIRDLVLRDISSSFNLASEQNLEREDLFNFSTASVVVEDNSIPRLAWIKQFGGTGRDAATSAEIDEFGNIYTAGMLQLNSGAPANAFLMKRDASGDLLWSQELGTDRADRANGITVKGENIVIVGSTGGSLDGIGSGLGNDGFVAQYDVSGQLQWVRQIGTDRIDHTYGAAIDDEGNVYVVGTTRGALEANIRPDNGDAFLAKYSASGAQAWVRQLSVPGQQEGQAVAVDSSGNIFITGADRSAGFLASFNPEGELRWNQSVDSFNYIRDIAIDSSGQLYLAGATRSILGDAVVNKFDENGELIWRQTLGSNRDDLAEGIFLKNDNSIYIAGSTRGQLGDRNFGQTDIFIANFDNAGEVRWIEQFGTQEREAANDITLDSQGNLYLVGETFGNLEGTNAGSGDAFIAKFSTNPNVLPDLLGKSLSVIPKPLAAGEEFKVTFAIENQGIGAATAFDIDFYLSQDGVISSSDYLLGSYEVELLAGNDITIPIEVEFQLPDKVDDFWEEVGDGNYYIGMSINAEGTVLENNRENNLNVGLSIDYDQVPVQLEFDEDSLIDLRVPRFGFMGREMRSFGVAQNRFNQRELDISFAIENAGMALSPGFSAHLYLSEDNTIDTSDYLLQNFSFPGLDSSESVRENNKFFLPSAQDAFWQEKGDGTYYVGLFIDPDDEIAERVETNNIEVASISIVDTPTIDLSGTQFLAFQSPNNEKEIVIDFRVQNAGPTPVGPFSVNYYLSRDSEISTSDFLLGSRVVSGLAGRDLTAPMAERFFLPGSDDLFWGGKLQNESGDAYYVGVIVDANNDIAETNEANNSNQGIGQDLGRILIRDVTMPHFIDLAQDLGLTGDPISIGNGMWFLGAGIAPQDLNISKPSLAASRATINADLPTVTNSRLSGANYRVGVWESPANGAWEINDAHQHFDGINIGFGPGQGRDNENPNPSRHATQVAGVIAGQNMANANERGIAFNADLVSYSNNGNVLQELRDEVRNNGLRFSNHSYGFASGWDMGNSPPNLAGIINAFPFLPPFLLVNTWLGNYSLSNREDIRFGKYDDFSRGLDAVLHENPNLLSVWSAGNDRNHDFRTELVGGSTQEYITNFTVNPNIAGFNFIGGGWYWVNGAIVPLPPGDGVAERGFDTSNGGGKTAKNSLVIGAISDIPATFARPYVDTDVNVTDFSAWGPTDDGRIRPDVVANGESVSMPIDTNNIDYLSASGTSFAAPSVTGAAVLLAEHYDKLSRSRRGDVGQNIPRSATLKGLLIHTAFDAGNPGPDYSHGWGVVDVDAAVRFLDESIGSSAARSDLLQERSFTGTEELITLSGNNPAQPLKVTIVWTDPPGRPHNPDVLDDRTPVLVNDLDIQITGPDGRTFFPWTLDPAQPGNDAQANGPNRIDNVEQVLINNPLPVPYTIRINRNTDRPNFNQDYTLLVSGANIQPIDDFGVNVTINRVKGELDGSFLNNIPVVREIGRLPGVSGLGRFLGVNRVVTSESDFYSIIKIGNNEEFQTYKQDERNDFSPPVSRPWSITRPVSLPTFNGGLVPIRIDLLDSDGGLRLRDDVANINPVRGRTAINLLSDVLSGQIWGDTDENSWQLLGNRGQEIYLQGDGGNDQAEIWFTIS
jgi:subtilase family serine protease